MKGVRDWVFSQILSKSVVSPSSLSGGNSFYAEEHRIQNENFNEQGKILILLFVLQVESLTMHMILHHFIMKMHTVDFSKMGS